MEQSGKINVYRCPVGHDLVTINVDEGVTPMFKSCIKCGKQAASMGYPAFVQHLTPTHEWYKPKFPERLSDPGLRQHCMQGGLLIRFVGRIDITEYMPEKVTPSSESLTPGKNQRADTVHFKSPGLFGRLTRKK